MSGDVPISFTQATLEDKDGKFEINEVITTKTLPTESGRITKKVSARSSNSIDDAIDNLDWD